MNFEDFKKIAAEHFKCSVEDVMEEIDRNWPEEMFVFELFDTGSVTLSVGQRTFVLSVNVEEPVIDDSVG